jgi:hypothetical protein
MKRLAFALVLGLAACSWSPKYYPEQREQSISLARGDLESGGIAFITPSTVTGQEQEKQAVALTFAQVLKQDRPALHVVTLAQTLGAINGAGLGDAYRRMYDEYRDSGLFSADVLRRVAAASGVRYLAQLKLQVWDAQRGSIAWEDLQELRIAVDTTSEEPVTLRELLERTAHDLVARLP